MMYAEFLEYSCGLHRQWKKTHCRKRCERTEPWTMQALMFFVKVCTCFDGSEFVNLVFISSEVCDSLWSQPVCGTLGFSWSCNTGSYEFLEFLLLDLQFRVQTCFGPGSAHKSDLIKASLQIDEKAMQDAQHTFRLHSQLRFRTWVNLSKQFKLKLVMKFHKSNQMTRPHYRNHRKKVPAFVAQEVHQLQGREVRCQRNVMQFLDALIVK